MSTLRYVLCALAFVAMIGLGFEPALPGGGPAEPTTLQAVSLVYPLRQRFKINALYDHTGPGQGADNQIQIYTQALVRNDPPAGDECNDGGWWGYTDGDANVWNLRWDQDNDPPACSNGGPGWLWYDGHEAFDLSCPANTPVVAARQGNAYQQGGDTIYVSHGGGYATYYRHLNRRDVGGGQAVSLGQQIGLSGVGGTGAHLHFELRISGAYADPYGWEQGNLWAGGEPFPMGYLDQNNTPRGPFPLDSATIRDKWLTEARKLGSPIGDDYTGTCPGGAETTCCYQPFERGYVYYQGTSCAMSGSAQVVYYGLTPNVGSLVFLPRILASESASAWNSTVYIRNLNASGTATVSIAFYTADGRVLDSRVYDGQLPAKGSWEVNVRDALDDEFLNRSDYAPVFQGSAVVASDQDIAVVVRTDRDNSVTAYTGVSTWNNGSGWGQPGSTAYVPFASWDWAGTPWKTTLYIQNTTPNPASLTFYYCPLMANCEQKSSGVPLSPYEVKIYSANEKGSGFGGVIRVVSTQPIAVVATQESGTGANFWGTSDYNAFAAGATTVYLPSLMVDWYNARSSFTVQNLGTSATGFDIYYVRDYDGQTTYRHFPKAGDPMLPAGTSTVITQWDSDYGVPLPYPPAGWHGSARVVSTEGQSLAILVNQQFTGQNLHQAYSGSLGGGATLYAPFAANAYATSGQTYSSATDAQNLATTPKDITSTYFYGNGPPAPGGHQEPDIGWLRVVDFYVPSDPIHCGEPGYPLCPPVGQRLSGRITIESGGTMCGIHNIARASGQNDYGASYNMVQR